MPIIKIEVNEYQCVRCGYKWINRFNGKDGPMPKKCARCKRSSWKGVMSSEENGLRRRITRYNRLYSYGYSKKILNLIRWNPDIVKKFLDMQPRPTTEELKKVILLPPLRYNNSGDTLFKHSNYAPDPNRPGHLIPDRSGWIQDPDNPNKKIWNPDPNFISDNDKAIIEEAQSRRKLMEDMIKERGIA